MAPGLAPDASAYEFEVEAQTFGQGYALRSLRFQGPSLRLPRRRFTQTLGLYIWDIGKEPGLRENLHAPGPAIYITTYLRIDHDFGAWSSGTLAYDGRLLDAVDVIPELESSLLSLEVLYGYMAAEGLFDDKVDIYAGRLLEVSALDWWSMDGVKARVHMPAPALVEVFGGLAVRDSSPLASGVYELDGTGSAECAEYVEGELAGSGGWRPIDRVQIGQGQRFENDYDLCPQRDALMPTFGGRLATRDVDWLDAHITYRRAMSRTPGLIGPVNRFAYPDAGYYPDEANQAPGWGVNSEVLALAGRAHRNVANGRGQVTPYAAARYNLTLGTIDEGHLGARLRYGAHSVEPELYYSFPSFDADSIFNVFSVRPYLDARVTYDVQPEARKLSAYARTWLRRFGTYDDEQDGTQDGGEESGPGDLAGGVQVGARYRLPSTQNAAGATMARLDLFYDGGYGGQRLGGYLSSNWQASRATGLRARLSIIHFDSGWPGAQASEYRQPSSATSIGVQLGASYEIAPGIMAHGIAEQNVNRLATDEWRLLGALEMAFLPEL